MNTKKLKLIGYFQGLYFYVPVFTLFLLGHGVTLQTIILAQTVYSVASLLGELPTGFVADKFGQKTAVLIGFLLDSLGMLMIFLMPSVTGLIVFHLVRGLSGSFLSGSQEALLYESYKHEHESTNNYKKAFSTMLSNDVLGFITATAIAGVLVQIWGKSAYAPIILLTSLCTLGTFLYATTLKSYKTHTEESKEFRFLTHIKQSMRVIKKEHTVAALTVVSILTLNGEYFLRQTYQPLFQQNMVTPILLGLSLSAGSLLNYVIVRYAYLAEKYLSLDKILLVYNLMLGALYIVLSLLHSPFAIVLAFIFLQGLFNAQQPIVSDYINERIESGQRATVLSAISFSQSFFSIITRLLLVFALGAFGLTRSYAIQGLYLVIGIIFGYWYMRRCGCVHRIHHHDEELCLEECPEAYSAPAEV